MLVVAAIVLLLVVQPPGFVAMFAFLMPLPLLITAAKPEGWLGRLLESHPAVWFGRISYSVYLWQMLFLVTYGIPESLGWAQRFPVNLVLILAPATASYYLVEGPLRRIGRRWSRLRAFPAVTPMSAAPK